jgi:hypothetical protein
MTPPTDWRALCAELIEAAIDPCENDGFLSLVSVVDRIRTALSQPEREGPTDEELDQVLFQAWNAYMDSRSPFGGPVDQRRLDRAKARAVLARWGRPAIKPISAAQLFEPEWKRQRDQTGKTTDGAQLIDGKWWVKVGSDIYSMQRILDNARPHA